MDEHKAKTQTSELVKKHISALIGVEPEDIETDDSFSLDLHMSPAETTDLLHSLSTEQINITNLDLTDIQTVGELIEAIDAEKLS